MNHTSLFEIILVASFSMAGALLIHAIVSQTLFGNEAKAQKARVRSDRPREFRND